jgi:hypothetical protein
MKSSCAAALAFTDISSDGKNTGEDFDGSIGRNRNREA